ncbi:hypothetical protein ACQBAU_07760 [Propionibacteriaceae bacterium Y2011]
MSTDTHAAGGNSAPKAPGRMGHPVDVFEMRSYLDDLHRWLQLRRQELDEVDTAIQASKVGELTGDIMLSMMLWKAVADREQLLLATWDGGRVGVTERERLSALIWGRMDATLDPSLVGKSSVGNQLGSALTVSLPEACRLSDALVNQLRMRLALDPAADEHARHIKNLRAQLERIRDQVGLEPTTTRGTARAQLDRLVTRLDDITAKAGRGGDVGGLLGPLELDAAQFERDLIVGGARRREARDKVGTARERLAELKAREAALQSLAERCVRAVHPAPRYAVPDVDALGPVPNTASALDPYLDRLGRVGQAMTIAQEAYAQALAERDTLAEKLEAHRAKAAAHGLEDQTDLTRAYAMTLDALGRSPAPMPVCRALVELYGTCLTYELGRRNVGRRPR